jgi:hypothetical protein
MTTSWILSALSILAPVVAFVVYGFGVWRRWKMGADGRPAWASNPDRFREHWTAGACALILVAIVLQVLSRTLR